MEEIKESSGKETESELIPAAESVQNLQKQAWSAIYSNPKLALELSLKAYETGKKAGLEEGEGVTLRLVGNSHYQLGNYNQSLDYYKQALAISEADGDRSNYAASIGNIGNVYQILGDPQMALKFYSQALKIYEQLADKHKIGSMLGNIGNTYGTMRKCRRALVHHFKALKIMEELADKQGMAFVLGNIGNEYKLINDKQKSLEYFRRSIEIAKELGNNKLMMLNLTNIGALNTELGRYRRAGVRLNQSLKIAKEVGARDQLMVIYKRFSELYEKQEKWKNFSKYFKKYHELEKELKNEEVQKKAAQYELEKEIEIKEKEAEIERLRNIELKKAYDEIEIRNSLIEAEKIKSEKLLLNILPGEIANELKETGFTRARHYDNATVMFTDFKDFTRASERLSPQALVNELHNCFMAYDKIMEKHKLEKIKTIGDSYMAVSGLPVYNKKHAIKMVDAALEIAAFMQKRKEKMGESTFEVRIGIHSGSVVAGVVGLKKFAYDIWGDTVNIAARMEQHSEPGKINISATTYELVKNKYNCVHRGKIDVKNKGCVEMYFVLGLKEK